MSESNHPGHTKSREELICSLHLPSWLRQSQNLFPRPDWIVDTLRTATAWWTQDQQAFYNRYPSVRDDGNNAISHSCYNHHCQCGCQWEERASYRSAHWIQWAQAGFSLHDLADFSNRPSYNEIWICIVRSLLEQSCCSRRLSPLETGHWQVSTVTRIPGSWRHVRGRGHGASRTWICSWALAWFRWLVHMA